MRPAGAALPLRPEDLLALSRERGEPEWLSEFRLAHLRRFDPVSSGEGRYTRMKLDWKALPGREPSFPVADSPFLGTVSAMAAAPSPALALAPWAAANGGTFETLARPRQPFDQLVFSSWTRGLIFQWTEGSVDETVRYLAPEPEPGLILEPLLVDVAERASGKLCLEWKGAGEPGLRLTSISGRLGAHSALRLVLIGDGAAGHHHISLNLELGEGADAEVFGAWMGGRQTVLRVESAMTGAGSSWKETHVVWGDGREHADIGTRILHLAPRTRSDVQARAALAGSARSVFTGNVVMEKEALQGDAHLEDHTLLLSEAARADSVPGLQIRAMDVRASHAASTGHLDSEALFYLLSRGLDETQARRLLVQGFLLALSGRAPFSFLPEHLGAMLEMRVTA